VVAGVAVGDPQVLRNMVTVAGPSRSTRRNRWLVRDYETLPKNSEAMIHVAMIDSISKHITSETTPTWRGTY
jgi:hypothetical protein